MNIDTFLKSQTFKTGAFVLFVLFIFLIVFKLGVVHGYKKASFSQKYGVNNHRMVGSKFSGHRGGVLNKEMLGNFYLKKHFITTKKTSDTAIDDETLQDQN